MFSMCLAAIAAVRCRYARTRTAISDRIRFHHSLAIICAATANLRCRDNSCLSFAAVGPISMIGTSIVVVLPPRCAHGAPPTLSALPFPGLRVGRKTATEKYDNRRAAAMVPLRVAPHRQP